jgi:pimeloyl-ACP methyl ester carboxylesterase
MDYNRPLHASKDNPKVHIAIILVPGIHTGPEKASKSPLLLNPGGPGGSGFTFALGAGHAIQQLVGSPEQDIIGFDPRGIFFTTPRADCYSFPPENLTSSSPSPDEEDYVQGSYHRFLWSEAGKAIGFINSSDVALQQLDTRARSIAKLCQTKDEIYGDDSILKYVSTANVARDMLSIVDAWDEWTSTLNEESASLDTPFQVKEELSQSTADESQPYDLDTKGKLVFWGFSYGTMLGATFASMFPDRVGRLILDGVGEYLNSSSEKSADLFQLMRMDLLVPYG